MNRALAFILAAWIAIVPALADGVSVPGVPQIGQVGAAYNYPPTVSGGSSSLTFESISSIATNGTATNFGTMTYGSGCTRVIIVMVNFDTSSNPATAVTVNGVSAAAVNPGGSSPAFINGGSNANVTVNGDIWETNSAVAGSSGTVSITWTNATTFGATAALYCLVTATPAANSTANDATGSGSSPSITLSVPSGGFGLVGFTNSTNNGVTSWTGATADANADDGGSALQLYVAHTTSTGSVAVTANQSGFGGIVFGASWNP
jgi:hypothetical protein